MSRTTGAIVGVNGNLLTVRFEGAVGQNEVGYARCRDAKLMCEIVRIHGDRADMQVFEDTSGLMIGDTVEFSGELLSIELAPGLLTQIYDGLQNPLPRLAQQCGFFLQRGTYLNAIPRDTRWEFTPGARKGDTVTAGNTLGTVPEGLFDHKIMVPFSFSGSYTVEEIAEAGTYTIEDTVAKLTNQDGQTRDVTMLQRWPAKVPVTAYEERLRPWSHWSHRSA